jgi:hypothetical protein
VDTSAILSAIWAKNALRREAGLPLWPVRETFERELRAVRWGVHVEENYAVTRMEVLAELRARHGEGFGLSAGGRWVIEALTSKALHASFQPS